jgi:hypothetical protein
MLNSDYAMVSILKHFWTYSPPKLTSIDLGQLISIELVQYPRTTHCPVPKAPLVCTTLIAQV